MLPYYHLLDMLRSENKVLSFWDFLYGVCFFNFTFSSIVNNNFNCVRWEPKFYSFTKILMGIPQQSHPLPTYQLHIHISPIAASNYINNFNCVRWEPQLDSGQLSQRFSWEFLNRATPFQLLSSTLATLDKCIPKCIAIEVVSISLIDDLFYFLHSCCKVRHRQWLFSVFGEGIVSLDQHRQDKHKHANTHTHWIILITTQGKAV